MGEICNSAYFKVIFTVSHVFRSHLWRFTFSWKITSLVEIVRLFSTKSRTALSQSFRHARLCLAEGPRPPRTVHASGVFLCFPVLPRCQRGGSTVILLAFRAFALDLRGRFRPLALSLSGRRPRLFAPALMPGRFPRASCRVGAASSSSRARDAATLTPVSPRARRHGLGAFGSIFYFFSEQIRGFSSSHTAFSCFLPS